MAVTVVLSLLGALVLLVVAAFVALLGVRRVRPDLLDALPEPVRRLATANSFADIRGPRTAEPPTAVTAGAAPVDVKSAQADSAAAESSAIENPIYSSTAK